ncbi:hypothetical protein DFJ73DRAFT_758397 [Zopfochytrium polystomum]|nr:hypothetical protein DFJ73DRAFT_758397 [Zopfochytrium polystomum]
MQGSSSSSSSSHPVPFSSSPSTSSLSCFIPTADAITGHQQQEPQHQRAYISSLSVPVSPDSPASSHFRYGQNHQQQQQQHQHQHQHRFHQFQQQLQIDHTVRQQNFVQQLKDNQQQHYSVNHLDSPTMHQHQQHFQEDQQQLRPQYSHQPHQSPQRLHFDPGRQFDPSASGAPVPAFQHSNAFPPSIINAHRYSASSNSSSSPSSASTLSQFHHLSLDPSILSSFAMQSVKQDLDLDPTDPFSMPRAGAGAGGGGGASTPSVADATAPSDFRDLSNVLNGPTTPLDPGALLSPMSASSMDSSTTYGGGSVRAGDDYFTSRSIDRSKMSTRSARSMSLSFPLSSSAAAGGSFGSPSSATPSLASSPQTAQSVLGGRRNSQTQRSFELLNSAGVQTSRNRMRGAAKKPQSLAIPPTSPGGVIHSAGPRTPSSNLASLGHPHTASPVSTMQPRSLFQMPLSVAASPSAFSTGDASNSRLPFESVGVVGGGSAGREAHPDTHFFNGHGGFGGAGSHAVTGYFDVPVSNSTSGPAFLSGGSNSPLGHPLYEGPRGSTNNSGNDSIFTTFPQSGSAAAPGQFVQRGPQHQLQQTEDALQPTAFGSINVSQSNFSPPHPPPQTRSLMPPDAHVQPQTIAMQDVSSSAPKRGGASVAAAGAAAGAPSSSSSSNGATTHLQKRKSARGAANNGNSSSSSSSSTARGGGGDAGGRGGDADRPPDSIVVTASPVPGSSSPSGSAANSAAGRGSGEDAGADPAKQLSFLFLDEALLERRRRRRESHNAVERRRRDNINEKIHELSSLLPEFPSEAQNKGSILRRSVEYIKMMQALATRQQERMRELEGVCQLLLDRCGMNEEELYLSVPLGTVFELPQISGVTAAGGMAGGTASGGEMLDETDG